MNETTTDTEEVVDPAALAARLLSSMRLALQIITEGVAPISAHDSA